MRVVVTGATGFVGRKLIARLVARGDSVLALSRDADRARALLGDGVETRSWNPAEPPDSVNASDAVVHLAGEPVMARRWNPDVKRRILDSRVEGTRSIVSAIERSASRPSVFVCASGMDYYGDTSERIVDESAPAGTGFLADVCAQWEAEAVRVRALGVREARLRIGLVLGESGGALEQMVRPFRWFVGGPIAGGQQWIAWIHLDDLVGMVVAILQRTELSGAINAVAPYPVRMTDFARELGRAVGRPSWIPVPRFALRIVAGEAGPILAESKRLVPAAMLGSGFTFRHPDLAEALRCVLAAGYS